MEPTWQSDDGSVRLFLGDCLEVLPSLTGVDTVVTDPPYGIAWKRGINHARNSKPHSGILGDEDTSVRDAALKAAGATRAVVFGSFYAPFPEGVKQILVWHKPPDSGLVGSTTGFRRDAEPIFLIGHWPVRTCERSSVFRTLQGQASIVSATGHPHTKPTDLMLELVEATEADSVCDPFLGSGTTGVACVMAGVKFVGIEKDPDYFELAKTRIQDALGMEFKARDGSVQKRLFGVDVNGVIP